MLEELYSWFLSMIPLWDILGMIVFVAFWVHLLIFITGYDISFKAGFYKHRYKWTATTITLLPALAALRGILDWTGVAIPMMPPFSMRISAFLLAPMILWFGPAGGIGYGVLGMVVSDFLTGALAPWTPCGMIFHWPLTLGTLKLVKQDGLRSTKSWAQFIFVYLFTSEFLSGLENTAYFSFFKMLPSEYVWSGWLYWPWMVYGIGGIVGAAILVPSLWGRIKAIGLYWKDFVEKDSPLLKLTE